MARHEPTPATVSEPGAATTTGGGYTGAGLDFVALDVETANSARGSICALGLAVVRNATVVEQHSWLVQPPPGLEHFDAFNTHLHGISAATVSAAPTIADRLDAALDVIGDLPVIAHNAAFDMGAIREACDALGRTWPTLTYGCTLQFARASLSLLSYRLPLVAAELGVALPQHHDACQDATAAAGIAVALAHRHDAATLEHLAQTLNLGLGRMDPQSWAGCRSTSPTPRARGLAANPQADPTHPLYGHTIVFTGALSIPRNQAWARAAALGATAERAVTATTSLLVIGDGFAGNEPSDFSTAKAAKAATLRTKGQQIEVLTEGDFFALLAEDTTSGTRPTTAPTTA